MEALFPSAAHPVPAATPSSVRVKIAADDAEEVAIKRRANPDYMPPPPVEEDNTLDKLSERVNDAFGRIFSPGKPAQIQPAPSLANATAPSSEAQVRLTVAEDAASPSAPATIKPLPPPDALRSPTSKQSIDIDPGSVWRSPLCYRAP